MKRLKKNALLVYARIYTHQRFYFVGKHKGYYRDAHKGDDLHPIPPTEWQALCEVIRSGYSALKPNICRIVNGESYMQAMAEKSQKSDMQPTVLSQAELFILKKVRSEKGVFLFSHNTREAQPPNYYELGYSLPNPSSAFSEEQRDCVKILIERGILYLGPKESFSSNNYARQLLFHTINDT